MVQATVAQLAKTDPVAPEVVAKPAKGPVAFIVSHSSAGGVQQIWANLAEGFRDRGFETELVALYPYESAELEKSETVPWRYVVDARPRAPGAQLAMLKALVDFFRSYRPQIVFTAMPAANVLVPLAAGLAGTGARVVISHHSPVDTYNPVLNMADGLMGRLGGVETIISVSDTVKASQDGRSGAYKAKRKTIHNALPPAIEAHLAQLAQGRDRRRAQGRTVIAAGRLAAQKNYPVLIRAAAHMPDVEVQIVGAGADEGALKALARELGVEGRVRFLGHRTREETLRLVAAADVFAQPSLFEGHSLALVEAAKLGMPMVVSDAPVQIEGVSAPDGVQCGLIAPVHDDVALAKAILSLLDDPALYDRYAGLARHLGQAATYEAMLNKYQALI